MLKSEIRDLQKIRYRLLTLSKRTKNIELAQRYALALSVLNIDNPLVSGVSSEFEQIAFEFEKSD